MKPTKYNLLIDLNGTCHIGDKPTQGAIEAVKKLRAAQQTQQGRLNIRFCSNTSKESSESLLARLRRVGLSADLVSAHDVFTSLDAARRYVSSRKLRPLLLLSSSAQSVFQDDEDLARACFFAQPELNLGTLSPEDRSRLRSCDAVVIGLCPELMTQRWLDEAFRLLSGEYGAPEQVSLIATHRALYHRPSEGAALSLGPGAFVAALEAASHRTSSSTVVCGKPSPAFLEECIAGMISANERMSDFHNIIIGDDLDADLGQGTWQLGLRRILVRTGKFRDGDDSRGEKPADEVHDSFASWVDDFISKEFK
ncbi:HAD-superfamily hydrolase, subfamily IIA [Kalmanozyma brasiliensis GHG001]|uniref:HAD-superfamily hydrolase, subfamily IIA n=1 Tax=Kalmanozyma brasiliensis (strain GHG001) TaxID=1365824 RepID=UPI0028680223|nr:HAD-superfamily hydrolase, subfamily IIA [Kalmanozyma brasiliensis GHG001]KAF6767430.1 HAD-superfamily hydrolase, subfamily IIA [Kalmanozyma brasiliensis GHG001]